MNQLIFKTLLTIIKWIGILYLGAKQLFNFVCCFWFQRPLSEGMFLFHLFFGQNKTLSAYCFDKWRAGTQTTTSFACSIPLLFSF